MYNISETGIKIINFQALLLSVCLSVCVCVLNSNTNDNSKKINSKFILMPKFLYFQNKHLRYSILRFLLSEFSIEKFRKPEKNTILFAELSKHWSELDYKFTLTNCTLIWFLSIFFHFKWISINFVWLFLSQRRRFINLL